MTSIRRTLLASIAILVVACGGSDPSNEPTSSATDPAPSPPATPSSTPAAVASPSALLIGVVVNVGVVNDKGLNEYTFDGAKQGASAIGAAEPLVVIPSTPADGEALLQAYVDQAYGVVVAAGPALQAATAKVAKANPNVWFVGVDQEPCAGADGAIASPSIDCTGDATKLSPKYIAIRYPDDQAGYLAGMVAASASRSGVIGAIGGDPTCASCIRSMQGFALGATSVNPDIRLRIGWVAGSAEGVGGSQGSARTFADRFIAQNAGIDVVFQVGGSPDNGVIDAACAARISAIGGDVDRTLTDPASRDCILTSAEKRFSKSVADTIVAIDQGTATGGSNLFDASDGGIGLSPFYDAASRLPTDMQARIDAATAAIAAGRISTCPPPPDCGRIGVPIVD